MLEGDLLDLGNGEVGVGLPGVFENETGVVGGLLLVFLDASDELAACVSFNAAGAVETTEVSGDLVEIGGVTVPVAIGCLPSGDEVVVFVERGAAEVQPELGASSGGVPTLRGGNAIEALVEVVEVDAIIVGAGEAFDELRVVHAALMPTSWWKRLSWGRRGRLLLVLLKGELDGGLYLRLNGVVCLL